MGNHKIQHPSPTKSLDTLTWKEPVRRRSLRWALQSSFHPTVLSSSPSLHPGLLVATLFLIGWVVVMLSGGSLPTAELLLVSLASGLLIGLLPRVFSSAQITIRAGQLIRKCGGCTERWDWAEMRDVQILETYRNGERRKLLWFRDSHGRVETIILPWRLESAEIKKVLAATNNEAA